MAISNQMFMLMRNDIEGAMSIFLFFDLVGAYCTFDHGNCIFIKLLLVDQKILIIFIDLLWFASEM